jgi:hypothetical protein
MWGKNSFAKTSLNFNCVSYLKKKLTDLFRTHAQPDFKDLSKVIYIMIIITSDVIRSQHVSYI